MMKTWSWDELSNEITEVTDRTAQDAIDREGGWQHTGTAANGTRIMTTDRHEALETEAETEEEARTKMAEASRTYQEMN